MAMTALEKAQLEKLDPATRLEQRCDVEAMEQISRDERKLSVDKVLAYAFLIQKFQIIRSKQAELLFAVASTGISLPSFVKPMMSTSMSFHSTMILVTRFRRISGTSIISSPD